MRQYLAGFLVLTFLLVGGCGEPDPVAVEGPGETPSATPNDGPAADPVEVKGRRFRTAAQCGWRGLVSCFSAFRVEVSIVV